MAVSWSGEHANVFPMLARCALDCRIGLHLADSATVLGTGRAIGHNATDIE